MRYKGYTLIEMSLYMMLSVTVLAGIIAFLFMAMQSKIKHRSIAEVESQGQFVLQQILEDITTSVDIITPGDGVTSSNLALERTDGTIVQYDVQSGNFGITEDLNSRELLTSTRVSVTSISFQELGPTDAGDSIRVEFVMEYDSESSRNEFNYEKTFYGGATSGIY